MTDYDKFTVMRLAAIEKIKNGEELTEYEYVRLDLPGVYQEVTISMLREILSILKEQKQ